MKIENPNYESPIEERIARELVRMCHDKVVCRTQVKIETPAKTYRVDFLLESSDKRVVLEADGRDFHEYKADRQRDIFMLNSGGIDAVIRFCGCDIFFDAPSCAGFLTVFAPYLKDESAPPLDTDTLWLTALVADRQFEIKPIVRMRQPIQDVSDHRERLSHSSLIKILGRTSDKADAVLQIHSPNFDRRYGGMKVWQIADYIRFKGMAEVPS